VEDEGEGGGEEEDEAEGDEVRDAAPHGRAAWTRRTRRPGTRARSARETTVLDEGGSKKKRKEGRKGGASRSSPARVQRPTIDIETKSGEVYCRPSL
jgi:hypothetical protein